MDKYLLPVIIIAVALLAAMFAGCTGTPPEDVPDPDRTYYIVGIDEFYPPYTFLGGTGNPEGFDVESMEWIARDQGLDIRFKVRDWYGILPDLLDKRIDIIYSGYSITPDRAKIIAFSDPYWVVSQGVVVKRGSKIKYEDVISGKVITGTEAKSTADDWIDRYLVN
ncbi:MAG: amino acid ABC transporter substrate-binding protein, partial [Methanomicrobium sp.]|nr:amino acid ABC transporter substrate-binding protein [Methanomicrobium sp.]